MPAEGDEDRVSARSSRILTTESGQRHMVSKEGLHEIGSRFFPESALREWSLFIA
jgi:hypothetical protein